MLSLIGWLDGLTALFIVIFGVLFASIILIKSRKREGAKLLKYGAFMGLFAVLLWLGPTVDFLTIILTGKNLQPTILYGILSYMWVAPAIITAMGIGTELIFPNKKKIIFWIYLITGIIFEILLFVDAKNAFTFTLAPKTGTELIDARFNYGHPTFILIAFFIASVLIIMGWGSIFRAKQTSGMISKKFKILAVMFHIFVIVAVIDAFLSPGILLFIARLGMIACAFMIYESLKPTEL